MISSSLGTLLRKLCTCSENNITKGLLISVLLYNCIVNYIYSYTQIKISYLYIIQSSFKGVARRCLFILVLKRNIMR